MAKALRATGQYREALSFYERIAAHRRQDKVANIMAPGSAPWDIDIACLHWICGDHPKAMQMMHDLAAGILDGSIQYASDAAGGMSQGLLLYYMAVSDNRPEQISFALDYMRNRLKRRMIQTWPCAVASYYLGDVTFAKVMEDVEDVDSKVRLAPPIDPATLELGRRIRFCDALFHDGVKSRHGVTKPIVWRACGNAPHWRTRWSNRNGIWRGMRFSKPAHIERARATMTAR